jgi:LysM repeat protein
MKKYIVRAGDTMWSISKSTGVRLNLLVAANPQVRDPNQLQPGTIIAVPELNKTKSKQKKKSTSSQGWSTPDVKSQQKTKSVHRKKPPYYVGFVWPHVIGPNDTWESIAEQYGVTLDQVQLLNDTDAAPLSPGDVVYVPSAPSGAQTMLDQGQMPSQTQPPVVGGSGQYGPNGWPGIETAGSDAPVGAPWNGAVPPYVYPGAPGFSPYGPNPLLYGYGIAPYPLIPGPVLGAGMPYAHGMPPFMGPQQFAPEGDAADLGPPGLPQPGMNSGPHTHVPYRDVLERSQRDDTDSEVNLPFPYNGDEDYAESNFSLSEPTDASNNETHRHSDDWLESSTWDAVMETPWHVTDVRLGKDSVRHRTSQEFENGFSDDDDKPSQRSE